MTNQEKYYQKIRDKHETINKSINDKYESVKHLCKREVIIHLTETLNNLNPSIIKSGGVKFDKDIPDVFYKIDRFSEHKVDIMTLGKRRGKIIKEILNG